MSRESETFDKRYGERSRTIQAHCAPWAGHMDLLPLHIKHGYRLLFSNLSDPHRFYNRFMCGSGRPMRFCDDIGVVHDCWQQPVPAYDDGATNERVRESAGEVLAEFDVIFKDAIERTHTSIAILSHPCNFVPHSSAYIEGCMQRIADANAHIYNADEWLTFQDHRRNTSLTQTHLDNGDLVIALEDVHGDLCVMIPAPEQDESLYVDCAGEEIATQRIHRLGQDYYWIDIATKPTNQHLVLHVSFSRKSS
jgi:hypothetical protein